MPTTGRRIVESKSRRRLRYRGLATVTGTWNGTSRRGPPSRERTRIPPSAV